MHLLLSANNLGSSRRLRLSQQRYRRIQLELEQRQQQLFPQLAASVAQLPRSAHQIQATRAEQEQTRRSGRPSRKEQVRLTLSGAFAVASSGADCYRRLLQQGLKLYRRGQTIGVEDVRSTRRYRLRTLGLADTFSAAQQQWRDALALPRLARGRQRQRDRPLQR